MMGISLDDLGRRQTPSSFRQKTLLIIYCRWGWGSNRQVTTCWTLPLGHGATETGTALNALGTRGTRGQGWQCVSRIVRSSRESRSTTGSLSSIRLTVLWTVVSVLSCRGRGSCVGPNPAGTEDSVPSCWPQGCSVVFPEIDSKPQVCLSVPFRTIWNLFFPPRTT